VYKSENTLMKGKATNCMDIICKTSVLF